MIIKTRAYKKKMKKIDTERGRGGGEARETEGRGGRGTALGEERQR